MSVADFIKLFLNMFEINFKNYFGSSSVFDKVVILILKMININIYKKCNKCYLVFMAINEIDA